MMKVLIVSNELKTESSFLKEVMLILYKTQNTFLTFDILEHRQKFYENYFFLKVLKRLLGNFITEYFFSLFLMQKVKQLLLQNNPDVVILGTDNAYSSPFFVSEAKKLNIRTVVIPFSLSNSEELLYACRRKTSHFKFNFFTRNYIRKYSRWFVEDCLNADKFFLCPTEFHFLILEILRIAPDNPWVICGGNSDFVLVNSQFEKDYYVRSGISESRIMIYNSTTSEDRNLSIDGIGQLTHGYILWSVPPDHLNSKIFASLELLVEWHLNFFRDISRKIIISPHPRLPFDFFESFNIPPNVSISTQSIHHLISGCAYFVASQSATIRFALAKRKFIINFKMYNLPYTEYSNLPMVYEVESKEDFENAIYEMQAGVLFSGFEYDSFENDYFESQGMNINSLLDKIIN